MRFNATMRANRSQPGVSSDNAALGVPLSSASKRRRMRGFTLVEVLAALAFMAIVIPVAIEGLRVANMAGLTGERRAVAGRIAERVINDYVAGSGFGATDQMGTALEGSQEFTWRIQVEPWIGEGMNLVTVAVDYTVQGRTYEVKASSLMDSSQ